MKYFYLIGILLPAAFLSCGSQKGISTSRSAEKVITHRVSYGETIKDTAVREIKEETGLEIEIVKFIGFQEILNLPEDYHRVVFYHLAKVIGGELRHSDDLSDAGFFSLEEIKKMNILESVEWVLRKAGFWK